VLTLSSNTFQKVLEAKRNELSLGTSNRDEIRIENAAEDFDRLQQRMNREVAIRNLDRESRLLKSVEEALARIANRRFRRMLSLRRSDTRKAPRGGSLGLPLS
jgi:RNA polymerase-binding transcription factor DksA